MLIEIRAGPDSRWQRSQERGRTGDASDKETFFAQEKSEEVASDEAGQALMATAELANLVLFNDGSIDSLYSDLEEMLEMLS